MSSSVIAVIAIRRFSVATRQPSDPAVAGKEIVLLLAGSANRRPCCTARRLLAPEKPPFLGGLDADDAPLTTVLWPPTDSPCFG